ncbi:MAG: hypothetical protein GY720_15450 [bacterium]|nr:hypothetical protein [bacterium]
MALLIEETLDVAAHVTAGVVDAYTARRERVQQMSLGELVDGALPDGAAGVAAVVAGDMRIVEIVADDEYDLEQLASATWALAGRGWDVTVLVPCNRLGDAHSSLRAAPCQLQGWWFDENGVWFGAHETP